MRWAVRAVVVMPAAPETEYTSKDEDERERGREDVWYRTRC